MIGANQQQVIRTIQQQPATAGNTQVIRGGTQPSIIQMTQLHQGDKQVGSNINNSSRTTVVSGLQFTLRVINKI